MVESVGRGYYSERLNKFIRPSIKKWIHIENVRSQEQAVSLAQKSGKRVVGVRKFDETRVFTKIEDIQLQQAPMSTIQMDELISVKQQKKIDNRWKDKEKSGY